MSKPASNFFRSGFRDPLGDSTEIHWRLAEWYGDLGPEKLAMLKVYHEELIRFNAAVNLISVKTLSQADSLHFADSICASRIIYSEAGAREYFDFGSGNGFPGLVFGIVFPDCKIRLVDADERKCEFLKHVVSKLNIQNIQIVNTQFEKIPEKSANYGVSRALATLPKALLLLRKQFVKGGVLFHMKGEEWFNEVSSLPTQLCSFWRPALVKEYKLPVGEVAYSIVKTTKIAD
ncbi:MAG: 16S rRNA (guanine(527)-N(7))-methyltransferase RsmG [Bdellovibrio sp.]|nr:MAG: 16S rRNA (guanine(527)-N(7))-methyltransferase RsmG [Bdellovibrio sp.]